MRNTEPSTGRAVKTLSMNLMVEGRPCMVVGGGKVATRKAASLIEAGGRVTVISPTCSDWIANMADNGTLELISREFSPADVKSSYLVFAATNDKLVNRSVLEASRDAGCLCCCVDGNWSSGDMVSPATFKSGDLTVAVSTGGTSCRRSRLVKDNLARHIEMVETTDLIVMGTSHEYMSVAEREGFHLVGENLQKMGHMITEVWGVHEFMLVNTCNRVEIVATVSGAEGIENLLERILGFDGIDPEKFYVYRGYDAFEHLAVLTAGLLSQTPGENHIVAQVKEAMEVAVNSGWAGGMLQQWTANALHISKHIRKEAGELLKNFEIEDLCMSYLASEVEDFGAKTAMVLGSGVEGKALIRLLTKHGNQCRWCYHVNRPEVPANLRDNVTLCTLNDLRNVLSEVQVVICATASTGHVLHRGHAPFFDQESNVLVVDITMPRNVEPELDGISQNLNVVDLDDLKHWYRREKADMVRIMDLSKDIVREHKDLYDKIISSFLGRNTTK